VVCSMQFHLLCCLSLHFFSVFLSVFLCVSLSLFLSFLFLTFSLSLLLLASIHMFHFFSFFFFHSVVVLCCVRTISKQGHQYSCDLEGVEDQLVYTCVIQDQYVEVCLL
jgi:hypothetical protein